METQNPMELTTERLFLRTPVESNAEMIYHLFPNEYETEQDALNHIRWIHNNAYENRLIKMFYVWVIQTNQCIGRVYIHSKPELNHEVEIGYGIAEEHRKNGYATEAGKAVVQYAFESAGQEVLVAIVKPENIASRRVIEKLGFTKHSIRTVPDENGVLCDFDYFQLQCDDWRLRANK